MAEQPRQESNDIDLGPAQLEMVPKGQPDVSVVAELDRFGVVSATSQRPISVWGDPEAVRPG